MKKLTESLRTTARMMLINAIDLLGQLEAHHAIDREKLRRYLEDIHVRLSWLIDEAEQGE